MPVTFPAIRFRLSQEAQLGLLLLASCAIKFVYVFLLSDWQHYLFSDFAGYWDRAAQRAAGDSTGINQWAVWPPLWHLVLAEIFKVLDFLGYRMHALPVVLSLNILFSTLGVYLVYRIARLLHDAHGYAMLAAAAYAFCFPLVYFNAFVMSEHAAMAAVMAALFVLLRYDSARAVAASGFLLAVAVAMRPAYGLLGGLFFLYLVFRERLSWSSVKHGAVFALAFFSLLFLVVAQNAAISKGKLKGLSAHGGLNFYFAQCRAYSVTSEVDGYRHIIIPPATVDHPEYGSLTTTHPIYDQNYFYALGRACMKANTHKLADAVSKLDALYFGPLFPTMHSAWGANALLGVSRHLVFGMSLLALFFPLLLRVQGVNRPGILLLAGIPAAGMATMYFFNVEHRYLYSYLFAILLLSLLLVWKWFAEGRRGILLISLFGAALALMYLGQFFYRQAQIGQVERNLPLTITQNALPIRKLDQRRMVAATARFMTDRMDFPDSYGLRHPLLGELGWDQHFFIDTEANFNVEIPGLYEFLVYSDDGARLIIDGQTVSEFVGRRAIGESAGSVFLDKGVHSMKLAYFQNEGSCGLKAIYRHRDFPAQRFFVGQDSPLLKWMPHPQGNGTIP